MNPYEVLGVDPAAGIDEVEARYRLLLREYHPDLHQGEGPESIAFCETMTRNLNAAMANIRDLMIEGGPARWSAPPSGPTGHGSGPGSARGTGQWPGANPFYREPGPEPGFDDGFDPGPDARSGPDGRARDWFGNPVDHRPDEPVPCPFCGTGFDRLDDYELHLEHAHSFRQVATAARRESHPGVVLRAVGSLRFIPAWFVALVAFALWKVFGFYYFVGGLTFLLVVMWTQTAKMFKRR